MNTDQIPGGTAPPPAHEPQVAVVVPVQTPSRWEELATLKVPAWLDDWFPQAANALADGAWLAAWREVAAIVPVVGLAIGLLSRFLFGIDAVFSESIVFMSIVIAGALLSGSAGAMLFVGYVVQDLLAGNRAGNFFGPDDSSIVGIFGGKLVSYILLAIPAITIPLLANQLAQGLKIPVIKDPIQRLGAQAGIYGAICAVLVYLWTQSVIVLIRPLFTWIGQLPSTEAIYPVQGQTGILVGVAFLAGAGRVALEQMVASRSPRAAVVALLKRQRWTGEHEAPFAIVPQAVRVAVASAIVTLVLAGTYEGWFDALLVAVITGVIGIWRAGLIKQIPIPVAWATWVRRWPALVRLVAASLIGYVLANQVLTSFWYSTNSGSTGLRPVLLGALLTLVAFHLLFPPLPVSKQAPTSQPNSQATGAQP